MIHFHHHDMEAHATSFNEGFETAMSQHLADDPSAADEWLREHDAQVWGAAQESLLDKLSSYVRDDGMIDQHMAITGLSRILNPYKETP